MRRVGSALAGERFDRVFTSTRRRTVEAARWIVPELEPVAVPGFDEIHFGRWEGLTREEIAARDPARFERWRMFPAEFAYPEGEHTTAFRKRVAAVFRALLPEKPERILVVAHKGVIRTILGEILALSSEEQHAWPIDLSSIQRLARRPQGWHSEVVNDLRHLEESPENDPRPASVDRSATDR